MCTVCGCAEGETRIEGETRQLEKNHQHTHEHEHAHAHAHEHEHEHEHDHHHYGKGPAHAHAPGLSQSRMVQIEQDILGKNQQYADSNRQRLTESGILALNLVSSPGSGKTTLLTRTLTDIAGECSMAVIEGDQETSHDADRIRATGATALQVNTGKGCHLDAHQVGHAIDSLNPPEGSVLFIENVGNLVCPSAFDLGESARVVILSVTEGEDKPLKYPDMFRAANLLLLNKIDLLPYLDFDLQACIDYARRVNPGIQILPVSARSGEGLSAWYTWLRATRQVRLVGHTLESSADSGVLKPGERCQV